MDENYWHLPKQIEEPLSTRVRARSEANVFYEHVIDIDFYIPLDLLAEHLVYQPLVCGFGIL